MGLFGFGKKKSLDQPVGPMNDASSLSSLNTDLPDINGNNMLPPLADLPPLPQEASMAPMDFQGIQSQAPATVQALPQNEMLQNAQPNMQASTPQDAGMQAPDSKSITFNIPTFDFSMPDADDDAAKPQENEAQQPAAMPEAIDEEDLNRLFISDGWKEPDFNNFDPYTEERIEEPKPQDFGNLPSFDNNDNKIETVDIPPAAKASNDNRPVELFIRGRAYSRVFVELEEMSADLTRMNSRSGNYSDILKREDELLLSAKDQMEYLYKRINTIDKKIFVQ